jgi:hypothetical protein
MAPAPAAGPASSWHFIGARGAEKLRSYRYSVVDRSIIAPYYQPFWTRFVQIFPDWFAPNCITVLGAGPPAPPRRAGSAAAATAGRHVKGAPVRGGAAQGWRL